MANFRSFTLYNKAKTDSVALNDFSGYLVYTPEGLGIYLENEYLNVGSKLIRTKQSPAFKPLSIRIGITAKTRNDLETKYSALRNFIAKYRREGFCFAYIPFEGVRERYIECDIKDFDKTEKQTSRFMVVPVTIKPRTMWRVDEEKKGTVKDDELGDINEWVFAEDANIDGIIEYDVLEQNKTDKVELTIYGYDKAKIPQGLSIKAHIVDVDDASKTFDEIISLDEGAWDGNVFVVDHIFNYNRGNESGLLFSLFFDTENESVKAYVRGIRTNKTDLPSNLYTETLIPGVDAYVLKVEFDDSIIDEKVEINLYYTKKDGSNIYQFGNAKQKGEKIKYITLQDFASWSPLTQNSYRLNEILKFETFTFLGHQYYIPGLYRWDLDGVICFGTSNYVASLLYEIGTDEYNIAMFTGAISKNTLTNDGDSEVPLKIQIAGIAVNPTIRILPRGGGAPIQTSKVNYTIPTGAYLEIDSDPENTGAWLVASNGTRTNALSVLDQTTNMFLTLPMGEYDIQILNDNNEPVVATVLYKKEYLGA